jgi:hypothetical protein
MAHNNDAFNGDNNFMMQMGVQYGQKMWTESESVVTRFLPMNELKKRFRVSTSYVQTKLGMMLMPFGRKFERRECDFGETNSGGDDFYPPMDDVCSPDLYIPVMALITYITLTAFVMGLGGKRGLSPQDLATTASFSCTLIFLQVLVTKVWRYVVGLVAVSIFDLIAAFTYAFVPVSIGVIVKCIPGLSEIGMLSMALVAAVAGVHAFFFYKTMGELCSRQGKIPTRALPLLYAATAFQVPVIIWCVNRIV